MAAAWVPLAAVDRGTLPAICAKTGAAADQEVVMHVRTPSGWVWMLFLGVLPYLIVRHFLTREIQIALPFSARAARRLARARLARVVALVECASLLVVGAAAGKAEILVLSGACLAGALVALAVEFAWSVRTHLKWSARGILLTGVHPDFRDAVDRRQQRAWLEVDDAALTPRLESSQVLQSSPPHH